MFNANFRGISAISWRAQILYYYQLTHQQEQNEQSPHILTEFTAHKIDDN